MEADHPINSKGWMDAYPIPRERPEHPLMQISVRELDEAMSKGLKAGKDILIVDVRRSDCTSLIPGAINLPAHSFCASLPAILQLLSEIPIVVFHCNRSNGRGPRTAGWYADALQSHLNLTDEEVSKRVRILTGGIVAWEAQFGEGFLEQRGVQSDKRSIQL